MLKLLEEVTVLDPRYKKVIGDGGVERTNVAYELIKSRCYVIDAASSSCQATSPVPD